LGRKILTDARPKPPPSSTAKFGELTITRIGAERFDWRDPYHAALTLSWPGFLGVVILAIVMINVIFAILYLLQPGSVNNLAAWDFFNAFFFSIETFATVGYGVMSPATSYGHTIATIEIITGLLSTAVLTGLLFVRLSKPTARFLFSNFPIACKFDGVPTLMIRLANGRSSLLHNCMAELTLVEEHISVEGISSMANRALVLVRNTLPIFGLSWTLMHPIDERSPLYGIDFETLAHANPNPKNRLILSVTGFDSALSAAVFGIQSYSLTEVVPNVQFVDLMVTDGNAISIDLTNLNVTKPQT
jgi:inward rectifier potassium channel